MVMPVDARELKGTSLFYLGQRSIKLANNKELHSFTLSDVIIVT